MAVSTFDAMTEPTDAELIQRTVGGDGDAFGLIVQRYQRKIYRVAWAIVRDETEADIVTQDTFVQAYTHLNRFEGRSELETWLTRIAINRSRDSLRSRRWLPLSFTRSDDGEDAPLDPPDERPDAEKQMEAGQIGKAIDRAVSGLSAQQKIIFRLRHYENHSLEEIADMLGLRAGTVRAHLFRAVHKVRGELAHWGHSASSSEGSPS